MSRIFLTATGANGKADITKVALFFHSISNEQIKSTPTSHAFLQTPILMMLTNNCQLRARRAWWPLVSMMNSSISETTIWCFVSTYGFTWMQREPCWPCSTHVVPTVKEKASACKFDNAENTVSHKLIFSFCDNTSKLRLYVVGVRFTLQKMTEVLRTHELMRNEQAEAKAAQTVDTLCHQTLPLNYTEEMATIQHAQIWRVTGCCCFFCWIIIHRHMWLLQ